MSDHDETRMILLKKANSNWNLFYDSVDKCVKSIATNQARKQGARDSIYGSVNHFLHMFE